VLPAARTGNRSFTRLLCRTLDLVLKDLHICLASFQAERSGNGRQET
jgi:hypothetical protein